MQLHHVSRRTFGALAVLILSAFVRFAHRVSIERVPSKPHLELLAGAVGMGGGMDWADFTDFKGVFSFLMLLVVLELSAAPQNFCCPLKF